MMASINPHGSARYTCALTTMMLMTGLMISPPIHHHVTTSTIHPITLTSGSTLWDLTGSVHQIATQLQSLSEETSPHDRLRGPWTIIKAQTYLDQLGSTSLAHSDDDTDHQIAGSMNAQPITAVPLQQISTPEQNFAEEASIVTSVVGGNTIIETWTPLVVNGTPEHVDVPAASGITVIPESVPLTSAPEVGSSIIHEIPLSDVPEAYSPEVPIPAHESIPLQSVGLGLDFSLFSLVTNLFEDVIDIDEILFGDLFRVGIDLVEDMVAGFGDAITDLWDLNSTLLSGLFAPRAVTFPLLADQGGYAGDTTDITLTQVDHDNLSGFLADHLSVAELASAENSDLGEESALGDYLGDEDIPNLDLDW